MKITFEKYIEILNVLRVTPIAAEDIKYFKYRYELAILKAGKDEILKEGKK